MSRIHLQGLAVIAALTIPSLALITWARHIQLGGTHS
jgi:hypothetical protein